MIIRGKPVRALSETEWAILKNVPLAVLLGFFIWTTQSTIPWKHAAPPHWSGVIAVCYTASVFLTGALMAAAVVYIRRKFTPRHRH